MKIVVLIAGILGSLAGFYLGAENGLTPPAADGSESFTVGFLVAVLGSLVGLVGAGLSMFKPKLASILLLVGGIAIVIGVLSAWPATALLVVSAALALRAPGRERSAS